MKRIAFYHSALALLVSVVVGSGLANGAVYNYTKIAHTSDGFVDISGDGHGAWRGVSINDSGIVAFGADDGSGRQILTGSGGMTTAIVDSTGSLNYFESPTINNMGQVAFIGGINLSSVGILVSDGTTLTTISTSSGVGVPSLNDAGTVAFKADAPDSGHGYAKAIYAGNGGPLVTIADGTGQTNPTWFSDPAINNNGLVAYRYSLGVFVSDGTTVSQIADESGPLNTFRRVALNDNAIVALNANSDTGGVQGVFTSDGAGFDTIADSTGPFHHLGYPNINDAGIVAFNVTFDTGGGGIFVGPDPLADKVIASGDPLFGSTVAGVGFQSSCLNESGQVAFAVLLADGTRGIFRADPVLVLEPTTVSIDIKPGSDSNSINLKSKGLLPVAILSTHEFNALAVDIESLLFGDPLLIEADYPPVNPIRISEKDVTGDGLLDLSLKFSIAEMVGNGVLGASSVEAVLMGSMLDGTEILGSDTVRLVGRLAAVPEPSTIILAAIGFLGLLACNCRRRTT